MNVFRFIKDKWRDWRRYHSNIKHYKEFLKIDAPYDNASIYTVLKLKLQRTSNHYTNGLYLPYVDYVDDHQAIVRALFLTRDLEWIMDGNDHSADSEEFEAKNDELFDILKKSWKWWD